MNFLFKILIIFYSFVSFLRRKVFIKNISRDDLVLDVGSGDKPFWRADVIVDKYLEDDKQRASGSIIFDKRKLFVKTDVENLPFKDKAFDFVFCSHLLEHVENPAKAIKEITRVGKRGYLEVPRAFLDFLEPFSSHLWLCELEGEALVFKRREKERGFYLKSVEKFAKHFFAIPLFQYLLAKNLAIGFICLYWERRINFKIEQSEKKPYIYHENKGLAKGKNLSLTPSFIFYKIFYIIMTAFFYKPRVFPHLERGNRQRRRSKKEFKIIK